MRVLRLARRLRRLLARSYSRRSGRWSAGERPFEKRERLLEKRESLYNNIFVFGDADSVTMTFGQNKRYFTESIMKLSDPRRAGRSNTRAT